MAQQKRDYYEVLGISKGASADEIKKASAALPRRTTLTSTPATQRPRPASRK